MRSTSLLVLAMLAAGCSSPSGGSSGGAAFTPLAPVTAGGPTHVAAEAVNALGIDVYRRVATGDGNLVLSPASIGLALDMTYLGARGETAAQMKKVLHAPDDSAVFHASFSSVIAGWQAPVAPGGAELRSANRLFGDKRLVLDANFQSESRTRFGAGLEPVDFQGAADAERKHINGWVSEQTQAHIQDLLPDGSIDDSTRLVLVNALYFKARWTSEFSRGATQVEPFTTPGGEVVRVPLMHDADMARYGEAEGVKLLELGYVGGRYSTLFVLPNEVDGLAALEERLTTAALAGWVGALGAALVETTLPRLRIDASVPLSLRNTLSVLGMPLAFDDAADFSGITRNDQLKLAEVFHKAFVLMDEEGTEAAAATAVTATPTSASVPGPGERKVFKADHPFLFSIRDTQSGMVLFVGRVTRP